MKRILKDYKTIGPELLSLINQMYPDGIDDMDIISFKKADGTYIKALEIKTEDVDYLIKVDTNLEEKLEDFDEDDYTDAELDISNLGDGKDFEKDDDSDDDDDADADDAEDDEEE